MARWARVLGTCVAAGCLVHVLYGTRGVNTGGQPQTRERAILEAARHQPADAALVLLSNQLNLRHFAGTLPNVQVMWSSDLDRLDGGDYRLNGMTDGKVILLKTALQNDEENVRRTLCHELVHVRFIAAGSRSTRHDAPFQAELRRIFEDGCFEAVLATPEEKSALKMWVDSERERLDALRLQVSARGEAARAESDAVHTTLAELNDSNRKILSYNAALAAFETDQRHFNDVVRRYNLMQAYPDGLAEDRAKGFIPQN